MSFSAGEQKGSFCVIPASVFAGSLAIFRHKLVQRVQPCLARIVLAAQDAAPPRRSLYMTIGRVSMINAMVERLASPQRANLAPSPVSPAVFRRPNARRQAASDRRYVTCHLHIQPATCRVPTLHYARFAIKSSRQLFFPKPYLVGLWQSRPQNQNNLIPTSGRHVRASAWTGFRFRFGPRRSFWGWSFWLNR